MMAAKKEKRNKIKEMKAVALKRRMADLQFGERDFAQRCGLKKRDAVSKWRAGASWPTGTGEQTVERVLLVPSGFFAKIAQGIPYEKALEEADTLLSPLPPVDMLGELIERLNLQAEHLKGLQVLAENMRKWSHVPHRRNCSAHSSLPFWQDFPVDNAGKFGRVKATTAAYLLAPPRDWF